MHHRIFLQEIDEKILLTFSKRLFRKLFLF
jgi:hypothetical protein